MASSKNVHGVLVPNSQKGHDGEKLFGDPPHRPCVRVGPKIASTQGQSGNDLGPKGLELI